MGRFDDALDRERAEAARQAEAHARATQAATGTPDEELQRVRDLIADVVDACEALQRARPRAASVGVVTLNDLEKRAPASASGPPRRGLSRLAAKWASSEACMWRVGTGSWPSPFVYVPFEGVPTVRLSHDDNVPVGELAQVLAARGGGVDCVVPDALERVIDLIARHLAGTNPSL